MFVYRFIKESFDSENSSKVISSSTSDFGEEEIYFSSVFSDEVIVSSGDSTLSVSEVSFFSISLNIG